MFTRGHRNMCERDSLNSNMYDTGRSRLTLTATLKKDSSNPSKVNRIPAIAQQLRNCGLSASNVADTASSRGPYHCKECSYCSLTIVRRL
ncbi:hypothetical protein TNCT_502541 [Trichonephila clavata]|uniref:Uncharacterized protein n=1 Tax=Trichonephila clavata TaxID=2740835 RepID=A0A8X6H823_TRICU|nr:hypothetical protein TNCT_502541 [Trichonephila clavata]